MPLPLMNQRNCRSWPSGSLELEASKFRLKGGAPEKPEASTLAFGGRLPPPTGALAIPSPLASAPRTQYHFAGSGAIAGKYARRLSGGLLSESGSARTSTGAKVLGSVAANGYALRLAASYSRHSVIEWPRFAPSGVRSLMLISPF